MKRKTFLMAIAAAIVFHSCNTVSKSADNKKQKDPGGSITAVVVEQDVPYTTAQRYFVNNTYHDGDLVNPKITTHTEFEKFFGAAPVMGKNGQPTSIDFSKQYIVAVMGKLTDRNTSININSLKQKDNVILLNYKVTEGEKESATIRPVLIIIVDNKYQGEIKLVKSSGKN